MNTVIELLEINTKLIEHHKYLANLSQYSIDTETLHTTHIPPPPHVTKAKEAILALITINVAKISNQLREPK